MTKSVGSLHCNPPRNTKHGQLMCTGNWLAGAVHHIRWTARSTGDGSSMERGIIPEHGRVDPSWCYSRPAEAAWSTHGQTWPVRCPNTVLLVSYAKCIKAREIVCQPLCYYIPGYTPRTDGKSASMLWSRAFIKIVEVRKWLQFNIMENAIVLLSSSNGFFFRCCQCRWRVRGSFRENL